MQDIKECREIGVRIPRYRGRDSEVQGLVQVAKPVRERDKLWTQRAYFIPFIVLKPLIKMKIRLFYDYTHPKQKSPHTLQIV